MQEACVVGTADDDVEADAEEDADEDRDTVEPELMDEGMEDEVDTRILELVTDAEDDVAIEERETELVTFALIELATTALVELERDEETEELIEADREAEDEVEVDAGADEDGSTIVPLTFLGIANAPPSLVDRYRATLFH